MHDPRDQYNSFAHKVEKHRKSDIAIEKQVPIHNRSTEGVNMRAPKKSKYNYLVVELNWSRSHAGNSTSPMAFRYQKNQKWLTLILSNGNCNSLHENVTHSFLISKVLFY